MKDPIPKHLRSTLELIERAYPQGVPETDYLPLLSILAEHLCHGNNSIVTSHLKYDQHPEFLNYSASYLNDVLKAEMHKPNSEAVMAKLVEAGFDEWVEDD